MASSNACWGIEIGAGAIKALKVVLDGDQLKVADFAYIPHTRVLSTPDIDQDDAKRVALGRLVSEYDLSKATIAVSVPGHSAFARFAKLPPVEPKKVPDIVKFEAVQQIPFPLEEVEWDYQTFISPDSPDIEVGIFAITKQRIASELAILGDVNLTPEIVTLSPVAVYNAIAYDLQFTETTPGTILLDVGTTSTDLIIADAGRVWVRTFPIGGHDFTNALVEAFKLGYPKAEKLKREAEKSKHARHVFQALRPVFSDLVQDVQRSIGYYQSMHPDANLERLIGMGSTFQLPGLRKYLKQQLGMHVYRIEQFKRLEAEGPNAAEFQAHALNFVTAYGLAAQGLDMAALKANLMPLEVTKKAMWASKGKWFAAAAGLSLVATGAMFIRPFMDSAYTNMETPPEISQATSLASRLSNEAREAGVTEDASQSAKIAQLMSLYEGRVVYLDLVRDVDAMLSDADAKAASEGGSDKGFKLLEMYTDYLFGDMPIPTHSGKSMGGRQQGGGRGRMSGGEEDFGLIPSMAGGRDFGQEEYGGGGAAETTDQGVVTDPRIAVTLQLSTTQPEVEVFVEETIKRWLEQHSQREGMPYYYNIEDFSWEKVDEIVHTAAESGRANRPGGQAAGRNTGRRGVSGGRRGVGRGGSRRAVEEGGGEGEGFIPGLQSGGGNERFGGGMPSSGAGAKLPKDEAEALATLNRLAPIEPPDDAETFAPDTVETIVRVTFVAVLGSPDNADAEGE